MDPRSQENQENHHGNDTPHVIAHSEDVRWLNGHADLTASFISWVTDENFCSLREEERLPSYAVEALLWCGAGGISVVAVATSADLG